MKENVNCYDNLNQKSKLLCKFESQYYNRNSCPTILIPHYKLCSADYTHKEQVWEILPI